MAIAVELEFEGGTLDQYDEVIKLMDFEPGGPGGPGGLFHWVRATDGGIVVTDVWRSQEVFQKFADEQIGPLTQQAGLPEPKITFHEVHNYLTPGPAA